MTTAVKTEVVSVEVENLDGDKSHRNFTVPVKKVTASLTIIVGVLTALGTAIGEVVLLLDQGQWEDVNTAAAILFLGALWSVWQRFRTKLPIAWGGDSTTIR